MGKEYYNNDDLLFEGEYRDGKRNGNEKEYYKKRICEFAFEYLNKKDNEEEKESYNKGKIKFEGEYLNGKQWNGKGKEYKNGYLVFEGEYLNGKRWNGKGIEYNYIGDLICEGEFLNGKRNGKGKEYKNKALISYRLQFVNFYNNIISNIDRKFLTFADNYLNVEKWKEKGKAYKNGDLMFEGEYKNGEMWNGKIIYKKVIELYEIKDGKGKELFNILQLPCVTDSSTFEIVEKFKTFFEEEFKSDSNIKKINTFSNKYGISKFTKKYFVKNKKIKEKKYQNDRTIVDKRKKKSKCSINIWR